MKNNSLICRLLGHDSIPDLPENMTEQERHLEDGKGNAVKVPEPNSKIVAEGSICRRCGEAE